METNVTVLDSVGRRWVELLFECLWRGVLLKMETNIKLIYLRVINRTKQNS